MEVCKTGEKNERKIEELSKSLEITKEKMLKITNEIEKDLTDKSRTQINLLRDEIEDDFADLKVQVFALKEENIKMTLQIAQIYEALKRLEEIVREIQRNVALNGSGISKEVIEELRMLKQSISAKENDTSKVILKTGLDALKLILTFIGAYFFARGGM